MAGRMEPGKIMGEGMTSLRLGEAMVHWLPGGDFWLDGGTLFAIVPKRLWRQVRPATADNLLRLCNDPLLIESGGSRILVDSGLGNTLDQALAQEYRVTAPWRLLEGLALLGIGREDIDHLVLTHGDFDHAGGVSMRTAGGTVEPTFPRATVHLQRAEWEDIQAPHRRSAGAYDVAALNLLAPERLHLVDGDATIAPGVSVRLSGGHTRGHQVVEIRSGNQLALALGDLLATHCHADPLWQLAYDNYPLTVIDRKIAYLNEYQRERPWILLYHDPFVRACRLDGQGGVAETWPIAWEEVAKHIADDFSARERANLGSQ